ASSAPQLAKEAEELYLQAKPRGDGIILKALFDLHAKNNAILPNLTAAQLKDNFDYFKILHEDKMPSLVSARILNAAAQGKKMEFFTSFGISSPTLYSNALREKDTRGQTLLDRMNDPELIKIILQPIPVNNRAEFIKASNLIRRFPALYEFLTETGWG